MVFTGCNCGIFITITLEGQSGIWAYAQQAYDLLPSYEFPLRASVADTPFTLAQEVPEPSKAKPKKEKSDRSGWAITPLGGSLGLGGGISRSRAQARDTGNTIEIGDIIFDSSSVGQIE